VRARAFQRTQEELRKMNTIVCRGRSVRAFGAHGTAIFLLCGPSFFGAACVFLRLDGISV